jgi:hypothetical protein
MVPGAHDPDRSAASWPRIPTRRAAPGRPWALDRGAAIEVEVWAMPTESFGRFVAGAPPVVITLRPRRTAGHLTPRHRPLRVFDFCPDDTKAVALKGRSEFGRGHLRRGDWLKCAIGPAYRRRAGVVWH